MKRKDIYQNIIRSTENLIQTRGYHAFSYRDVAIEVGVKTSSIHYYFPKKSDLVAAVVIQHLERLSMDLESLIADSTINTHKKIAAFFDLIFQITFFSKRKMCLGGMLAIDVLTLPHHVQDEVKTFFQKIENWLISVLENGIEKRELLGIQDAKVEAAIALSILEGALLLARLHQDEQRLAKPKEAVLERLLG